jgi:decaprenylphospho-beta-D-ribofuranose 2-oxidase
MKRAHVTRSEKLFCSLDRQTRCKVAFAQPDRYRNLFEVLQNQQRVIAAGAGLSYVGASFGSDVLSVSMRKFDRILAFSPDARTIEVEAGISVGALTEFLAGHRLMLPVQPGYPTITVGGCIAANVHGKNPMRDGLFSSCVTGMTIYHPDRGEVRCSPAENPEIFDLTVGGLGLTGVILSATLALNTLPALALDVATKRFGSLREGFALVVSESEKADSVLGWLNLGSRTRSWGTGLVSSYNFSREGTAADIAKVNLDAPTLDPSASGWRRWPLMGKRTVPVINWAYARDQERRRTVPLTTALYPSVGKEFYYDLYGERGFFEFQSLVPTAAIDCLLAEAEPKLREADAAFGLATIKAFRGADRHIDFNGEGISFTLDVPASAASSRVLDYLEDWASSNGAKINPIKYSRLTGAMLRRQFPQAERFGEQVLKYDPSRRFRSALSERLEL